MILIIIATITIVLITLSIIKLVGSIVKTKKETYHPNGVMSSELYFRLGKIHGLNRGWYEDGTIGFEYSYKNGKEDGQRINERYGVSRKKRPNGTIIWLHGTSVGESVAALALANSMKKNGYGKNNSEFFLLTTNTLSAAKLIKDKIKKGLPAIHQYHPYDHPKFVAKFIKYWKPDMAVFLESDFWPNLIYLTARSNVPTV